MSDGGHKDDAPVMNHVHAKNTKSKDLTPRVCVVGLGYIGLPTASMLATHGFKVIGVDVNEKINPSSSEANPYRRTGAMNVSGRSSQETSRLASNLGGRCIYHRSSNTATPDKRADLSFVKAAAESIVPHCP